MLTRNEVTNIMRLAERERDVEGKKERKKAFVEKKEKSKMDSKEIYNRWRGGKERNKTIWKSNDRTSGKIPIKLINLLINYMVIIYLVPFFLVLN